MLFFLVQARPCCLDYVPRIFLLIGYVKVTDIETTAFERRPYRPQEEGACHTTQGHMEKRQGCSGGGRSRVWTGVLLYFPREGMGDTGQAHLRSSGLPSLKNFGRLWAIGVPLVVGTWSWSDLRQGDIGLVWEWLGVQAPDW